MLSRNPADNVAVESKHTEIYIVCQVQEESKAAEKQNITSINKLKKDARGRYNKRHVKDNMMLLLQDGALLSYSKQQ